MISKRVGMIALAAAVAMTPPTQSIADLADGLVGGLVGGVVGGVIVNEGAKNRERKRQQQQIQQQRSVVTKRAPSNSYNSVARAQTREEQIALNYFGFPAGSPDGVRGRNTRNAISQYQVHMGYPVSGQLNEFERQFLVGSYHRAQSSGAATTQLITQRGQGTRGLLHAYRDEATGGTLAAVAPATQSQTVPEAVAVAPESDVSGGGLPNLFGDSGTGPSLASHCSRVSLVTNSNGGFVTKATLTDASFALSEQFCLARTYAIADGEELASRVDGLTPAKLEQQCAGFAPAMKQQLNALSLQPRDTVLGDVSQFILDAGMDHAQLSGTARICLSVGYRTDNLDVATGSALLLTALGKRGYAELLGHHLNEGFGAAKRPDLALDWYETGLSAVEASGKPIFVPGDSERTELLRQAVFPGSGDEAKTLGDEDANEVRPASTLPTFSISE